VEGWGRSRIRRLLVVFDMTDPSQLPVVPEPVFRTGRARVTLTPCTDLDDLRTGPSQLPADVTSTGT
jgi:hypothetical protein